MLPRGTLKTNWLSLVQSVPNSACSASLVFSVEPARYSHRSVRLLLVSPAHYHLHLGWARSYLWSGGKAKLLGSLQCLSEGALSPDGTVLATASHDGFVKFWQIYIEGQDEPR